MNNTCYISKENYVYPETIVYPPEVPYELEEEEDDA